MKCPRCQHDNRLGAKFCEECAAPLARVCANCGAQLSPTGKFCSECAHPAGQVTPSPSPRFSAPEAYTPKHLAEKILTSKSALEGERKQVTILFADLRGSMELLADRDPEEARKLLDPVLERMKAVSRLQPVISLRRALACSVAASAACERAKSGGPLGTGVDRLCPSALGESHRE